ncbi:MAG: hypothetical protein AVDCRST_MAG85-4144, partial [uncultured Solirubrobacteraceae bacterium]
GPAPEQEQRRRRQAAGPWSHDRGPAADAVPAELPRRLAQGPEGASAEGRDDAGGRDPAGRRSRARHGDGAGADHDLAGRAAHRLRRRAVGALHGLRARHLHRDAGRRRSGHLHVVDPARRGPRAGQPDRPGRRQQLHARRRAADRRDRRRARGGGDLRIVRRRGDPRRV